MFVLAITVAVFFTLFMVVFFLSRKKIKKSKKKFKKKKKIILTSEYNESSGEAAGLEEVSPGVVSTLWRPFTLSLDDSKLLPKAENQVIYEKNGIHYINNNAIFLDKNMKEKLDDNFVKLVESVVGTT